MTKGKKRAIGISVACVVAVAAGLFAYRMLTLSNPRTDVAALRPAYPENTGTAYAPFKSDSPLPGYATVAENGALALLLNEKDADIVVYDKAAERFYRTVPENAANDPRATTTAQKNTQSSQIAVHYYNTVNNKLTYTSYADCVAKGQFDLQSIPGGVKITYTFGDAGPLTGIIPWYITEERLQERVLPHLTEKEARTARRRYAASASKPGFLELIGSAKTSVIQIGELLGFLEKAGYTEEDYLEDNAAAGIETRLPGSIIELPVDYYLNDEGFVASVDMERAVEGPEVFIYQVDLLRNFGAAGPEDEGYIFVPNGSGALIALNNGKSSSDYIQYVYGIDYVQAARTRPSPISYPVLPVYGIRAGDAAWFAEITKGEALAAVCANVSGGRTSYNNAYAFFTVRYSDSLATFGESGLGAEMLILQDEAFDSRLEITYSFLQGEDATYSGMASAFRERLVRRGVLTPLANPGDMPFYLDILGSVVKTKHILTIPTDAVFPMTTFREGADMVSALGGMGVSNIRVRLQGWFNNGYFHKIPKTIHLDGALGDGQDLDALDKAAQSTGGALYPDVRFMQVRIGNNPGYNPSGESARWLVGYSLVDGVTERATMRMNGRYLQQYWHLLSPGRLPEHVNAFMRQYERLGLNAISLRDLGDTLYSDMRRSAVYGRDYAESIAEVQLSKIAAAYERVMVEVGNLYALRHATDVVDAHMTANKYLIIDEEVPFFQMVLHGYVDYAGKAVNLEDAADLRQVLLRAVEYAASPHFLLTAKSASYLKSTALNFLYSTEFEVWKDVCADMYAEINAVHKRLRGVAMTEHIIHSRDVREMRYQDGTSVYVNYGPDPQTVDGVAVPPAGYAVAVRGPLEGGK